MTTMTETNETTAVATDKAQAQATILKRSVCLVLRCAFIGNERKVPLGELKLKEEKTDTDGVKTEEDVKADVDELRLSKQLLDRKDLRLVKGVQEAAKAYLRSVATQTHRVFGSGTYLVPIASVLDVEARLKIFQQDLRDAVEALVEKYPAMIEKRRETLKELFNAKDYLSPMELRDEFDLDWDYVSFAAPDQLEAVDSAVAEAVRQKKEHQLTAAYDEVVLSMRAEALKVMRELSERLKPGADGKPKALRGTGLRDLQDYVDRLPKRNMHGDDDLVKEVMKVAEYSDGISVESLRDIPALRKGLQELAEAASKTLAEMVETTRRRAISFDDV